MHSSPSSAPARVFLSYKRNTEPDQTLVGAVCNSLAANGHLVYIDRELKPGDDWAGKLESQIRESDYLVVFLTGASSKSEMVRGEIEIARDQAAKPGGKPRIVPVRLGYAGPLPYPLNSYLDKLQYALWRGESDTANLVRTLADVIGGGTIPNSPQLPAEPPLAGDAQPSYAAPLPPPGGNLDVDDPRYIERDGDSTARRLIAQDGQTITIKGPRQMGKSSLMMRIVDAAMKHGKKPALLDLQLLDEPTRASAELCFRRFAERIAEELDVPDRAAQFWDPDTPQPKNCSRFVEKHILNRIDTRITLAIDEADILFSTPFRADFFAMLRGWHNDRSNPVKKLWRKLDIVLVTSTEPYLFIDRVEQSPFNVGEVLSLEDFQPDQVHELNKRHQWPLFPAEADRLVGLLGGHPYLIRKALYVLTGEKPSYTPGELFTRAADDAGPFGDHLRHYLLRLQAMPDLLEALAGVAQGRGCPDVIRAYRLQSAGLVKREGGKIVPRCKLYGDYFREQLRAAA